MRRCEGLAASAALAVLVFAGLALGSALAEPACPASAAGDTLVTGVTVAGTLMTENGEELVLAGLAFPQVYDIEEEYGVDPDFATAVSTLR